jgi:cytosine/adenosine deaminase-related metal-dependent hydrolase
VARGIPVLVGTDSLASTADLDLLGEVAVLRRAFPTIPAAYWLDALTARAAALLGLDLPGEVEIDAPDLDRLFDGTPWPRRWTT